MSATWPRRSRCCGRRRLTGEPEVDDGTIAHRRRGRAAAQSASRMDAPGRARGDARPSRRVGPLSRCSSWRPASCASASTRGSPSRRWPRPSGSTSMRSRRCGTGWRRLIAELFDWAEGRGEQPTARDVPVFRPFMLAHPLDDGRVVARRLCGRVEVGRHPRPAGPCRRRDPPLQPHRRRHLAAAFPTSPRPSTSPACSTASCWCAAATRARDAHGGAAASFNALQQRLGRKNVSAKMQGEYPAFVRLYDILFDGEEDLRALPWSERRARLERFVPQARLRALRPVAADRGRRASTRWRSFAPAPATRRSRA